MSLAVATREQCVVKVSRPLRRTRGAVSNVQTVRASLTNEQLAELLQTIALEQSRSAFTALFGYYAPRLKAFGLKQGVAPSKVEELVQETMLTVWRKASSFDPARGTASNWIFTILRNKRIDMFRKENRPEYELDEGMEMVFDGAGPDEEVAATQTSDAIQDAIKELPEAQLEIIQKAFFEDKSHGEIAEELGLPLGTVKSRIRLAVARLRLSVTEDIV